MLTYVAAWRLHEVVGGMCMCTQLLAMHAPSASTDTKAWGYISLRVLSIFTRLGVTWRILAVPFSSVLVALVLLLFPLLLDTQLQAYLQSDMTYMPLCLVLAAACMIVPGWQLTKKCWKDALAMRLMKKHKRKYCHACLLWMSTLDKTKMPSRIWKVAWRFSSIVLSLLFSA